MPDWLGGSFLNPPGVAQKDRWVFGWHLCSRSHKRAATLRHKAESNDLDRDDWLDIYNFFLWSWHFRDWLLAAYPEKNNELAKFVGNVVELQVAHDMCNGLKHAQLTRPKRDAAFNVYRTWDHFAEEAGQNPVQYRVASGVGQDVRIYDLFDLIDKCYESWHAFLRDTGLEGSLNPVKS